MPTDFKPNGPRCPAAIVLDTNVVLDWLVFDDPRCRPWARAVEHGRLRWIATAMMRSEFAAVLARVLSAKSAVESEGVLAAWDRWARLGADTGPAGSHLHGLRCRDPDDQGFIDLAIGARARWLLTRDRALLDLARQARVFGVDILRPADASPDGLNLA